jgi:hypothetical protein
MRRLSFTLVALCAAVLVTSAAVAQDASPPAAQGVREVMPELYYMQDDAGRLVPVPGFQYRDFVELFRIKEGLAGPVLPPAAVLERVTMRVDARDLAAGATSCPAEVTCVVRQSRGGWAAVPLDLRGLLLSEPPKHHGPGRMLVDAAPDGAGYRAWFDPPAEGSGDVRHTVTLAGRLSAEASPTQDSFELRLPTAVASRVNVLSRRPEPLVTVRPDAAGRVETIADADAEGSVVTITGLAGMARIRIATAAAAPLATAIVTQAECTSTVRIDGRTATIKAMLRLTDLPADTRRIEIALPPRTTLVRVGGDATLIERKGTADSPVVDVAVDRTVDGSAEIELDCEEPVDPSGRTPVETLGFAVAGIETWRQSGRVSLVVDGDWQATWQDSAGIRRVDPPAGQRPAGFVATFAYDVQPASMPVLVRPRRSRILVEPEYRYDVSASRIELSARLRVAARGAPVSSIPLVLDPDWVVEDVGPATLIDSAAVRTEGNRITLPFIQPLAGDAVLELRAVKAIDPTADRVAWTMPVPQADLVGPAVVVVSADADIELLPDAAAMAGLLRQTASAVEPGDAERIALAYRLDTTEGTFAAARRFLPRRVESSIVARVNVDDRAIAVEEVIRLSVAHVPLEFLELSVPETLATSGAIEVRQGGTLLEATEVVAAAEVDAGGEPLRLVRVFLPVPLLGYGTVDVRYSIPVPKLPREATVAIDVPIPLPVVTASGRPAVVVDEAATVVVTIRGDTWRREISGPSAVASRTFSAPKPQHVLPLAVSARTRPAASVTVVEATWLQTRLFPDVREDIATYAVSGPGGPLEIRLPPSVVEATALEVRINGEPLESTARNGDVLVITLPDGGAARRLIEIRSSAPWGGTAAGLGLPWPLALDAPEFPDNVLQRRFYREVLASTDDHVLGAPARWTSQQRWAWTGSGWRQTATMSIAELTAWMLTTSGDARPVGGLLADEPLLRQSRFVFAGIGSPGRAVVWVVPTWFIVLVSSGVTLGIGLLLVYREAFRKTPVLLAMTATCAFVAATMPETAVLVGQAAIPGGVMAMMAVGLRRALDQPAGRPRLTMPHSASSMTRSSSPTVSLIVAAHSSSGSTTTAAVGREP